MDFVKLLEILNNNCPEDLNDYDFFLKLIDEFTRPEDSTQEPKENPFINGIERDTVERYIRGQRTFGKRRLHAARRMCNLASFARFVDNYFSDTQKFNIETEIQKYKPEFNNEANAIGYPLAQLFLELIDNVLDIATETENDCSSVSPNKTGLSSTYYYDSNDKKIHIGGNIITLPPELTPPDNINDDEITYVNELLKAYADASGAPPLTIEDISRLSGKHKENFNEQRINYYSAVRICRIIRESYAEPDQELQKWKSQTFDYISDTYRDDYENGYKRLIAVLRKVVDSKTTAAIEGCDQLIQPKERKGVCHLLVNDGKIRWVDDSE